MDVLARIDALRARIANEGASAALVSRVSNLRYLTGFEGVIDEGINGACVVSAEEASFHTDPRYAEAAAEAAGDGPWVVFSHAEDLYEAICDELVRRDVGTLLIESSVSYGRFKYISERFGGSVRAVDQLVEETRQVKEPAEVDRIAAAAALADRGFAHILGEIAVGMTEREIALALEFFVRREGSDGVAFESIVASGPNSARPHARPGDRPLERGDFLILDFGACVDGYRSDMTRTIVVGEPSERQRAVYGAVLEANLAGIAAVRGGMKGVDVDAIARQTLAEAGLGDAFTHGLGHGVGLDVHELPTLGSRSEHSLRSGCVVTIEPGVYLPGWGGVRIEDLVVVEEHGCRVLSHAPKDLIAI